MKKITVIQYHRSKSLKWLPLLTCAFILSSFSCNAFSQNPGNLPAKIKPSVNHIIYQPSISCLNSGDKLKSGSYLSRMLSLSVFYRHYSNVDSIITRRPYRPGNQWLDGNIRLLYTELGNTTSQPVLIHNHEVSDILIFHGSEKSMPDSVTYQLTSCGSHSDPFLVIRYQYNKSESLQAQFGIHHSLTYLFHYSDSCVDFNKEPDGVIPHVAFDSIIFSYNKDNLIDLISNTTTGTFNSNMIGKISSKLFCHYTFDSLDNQLVRYDSLSIENFSANEDSFKYFKYKNEINFNKENKVIVYNHYTWDTLTMAWQNYYREEYTYTSPDTLNHVKIISLKVGDIWISIEKEVSVYNGGSEWIKKYYIKNDLEWGIISTSIFYLSKPVATKIPEPFSIYPDEPGISLYPNPCNSRFLNVEAPVSLQVREAGIYNLSGKLMKSQTLNKEEHSFTVDVKNLPAGMYMLKCRLSNGQNAYNKFLILK